MLVGGLLSGLGGAALSVDYTRTWAEGMSAGRGLVAVVGQVAAAVRDSDLKLSGSLFHVYGHHQQQIADLVETISSLRTVVAVDIGDRSNMRRLVQILDGALKLPFG